MRTSWLKSQRQSSEEDVLAAGVSEDGDYYLVLFFQRTRLTEVR